MACPTFRLASRPVEDNYPTENPVGNYNARDEESINEERIRRVLANNPTIPWTAISALGFIVLQFVLVVAWASNEHSQRVELQHRFDDHVALDNERNKIQDERITTLDAGGTRALDRVIDRQNINTNRISTYDERFAVIVNRLNLLDGRINELDRKLPK